MHVPATTIRPRGRAAVTHSVEESGLADALDHDVVATGRRVADRREGVGGTEGSGMGATLRQGVDHRDVRRSPNPGPRRAS